MRLSEVSTTGASEVTVTASVTEPTFRGDIRHGEPGIVAVFEERPQAYAERAAV